MEKAAALKITKGTEMIHARFGRVIARGSIHSSEVWGDMVWVDTPEVEIGSDRPYNAHISQLEFAEQ